MSQNSRFTIILTIGLVILFYFGLPGIATAAEDLGKQLESKKELIKALPLNQKFRGTIYSEKRGYDCGFEASFEVDLEKNELHFSMTSDVYTVKARVDSRLQVISSEFSILDQKTAHEQGHDKRITRKDPQVQGQLLTEFFSGKQRLREKKSSYQYYTLDLDVAHLILQAILINGIEGFTTDAIYKEKGWRLSLAVKLIKTANPTELYPQYNYPVRFLKIFEAGEVFFVYEVKVVGVFGLFYRYKYYMVYGQESPHLFKAYWGGAPERVVFIYTNKDRKGGKAGTENSSDQNSHM